MFDWIFYIRHLVKKSEYKLAMTIAKIHGWL